MYTYLRMKGVYGKLFASCGYTRQKPHGENLASKFACHGRVTIALVSSLATEPFFSKVLPLFINIRCFSFVKQIYLDIF
jgi:hypothetical protein